jgi:hypothetical protein
MDCPGDTKGVQRVNDFKISYVDCIFISNVFLFLFF